MAASTEPEGAQVALYPVAAEVILGYQDDPPGTHRSVVAQITAPGVTLLVGMTAEYAKLLGEGLIEHAGQISGLLVASGPEVEQLRQRFPRS
jgi:hypothetical protein